MLVLSPEDRPREKLWRHGAAALGDNELVALVIGSGGPGSTGGSALTVANALLRARGGLHGLIRSSLDEMVRIPGVGRARVAQVAAALELGRRTLVHAPPARTQIRSSREAAVFLLPIYGTRPTELFGLILLDGQHRVLRTTVVAMGGLNATSVEPREVFREALLGSAASVVVFHNHPSGDPTPSPEDVELTRRLMAAGELMGVTVLDHIVLGEVRYCSLKEAGLV